MSMQAKDVIDDAEQIAQAQAADQSRLQYDCREAVRARWLLGMMLTRDERGSTPSANSLGPG
jgi:hypothetical protein